MDYRLLGIPLATSWHFTTGYGFRSVLRKTKKSENIESQKIEENLIDWELALVSTLHSVVCIAFAIVILYDLEDEKVKGVSKWAEMACVHSIGFFIYDS